VGLRYTSNQFGDLDNLDTVKGVYGAMDGYTFVDAKIGYTLPSGTGTLSFGVNNLTDYTAFVYHPWPGRTFFAEYSVDILGEVLGGSR
jgi:iron complex outermembrane receptor protein